MTIRYLKKTASLENIVTVEEAEELQQWLMAQPKPTVNLGKCEHIHAAVLQVLLAVKPKVTGDIQDPWLAQALLGHAAAQA